MCLVGERSSIYTIRSYIIHFLSNGAVTSVDYMETDIYDMYLPIFYGGYVFFHYNNYTITMNVLYNNGSKLEIFQLTSRDSDILLLQKQNMIGSIRFHKNFWTINYYPLNSIDSNGKVIYHIKFI